LRLPNDRFIFPQFIRQKTLPVNHDDLLLTDDIKTAKHQYNHVFFFFYILIRLLDLGVF